jgi:cobalt/nickel transport system permease protein
VKRLSTAAFVFAGVAVAVALVLLVAPYANANPDGLERVAAEQGVDAGGRDHALAGGPFAHDAVSGVDDRYVGTWVAGLVGIALTFLIGAGVVLLARRAQRSRTSVNGVPA